MEEEKVRIRLFKDNGRYKSDLFVSVNGVNYKIRRGVARNMNASYLIEKMLDTNDITARPFFDEH